MATEARAPSSRESFVARAARAIRDLSRSIQQRRALKRSQEEAEEAAAWADLARADAESLKEAIRQEVRRQLALGSRSPRTDAQSRARGDAK